MPACRQMSLTGTPASACLRIETIWVSVKRDFFMEPPDCRMCQKALLRWCLLSGGAYEPAQELLISLDRTFEISVPTKPFQRSSMYVTSIPVIITQRIEGL